MKTKPSDLTGQRFGRLQVIGPWDGQRWLCRCRCGYETIVRGDNLTSGKTKSCGCLQIESMRNIIERAKDRQERVQQTIDAARVLGR